MRTKADVRRRFLNSRAHARPPSVTQECVSRSARRWARGTRNRRRDQPVGQITSCFPKWPVQPLLQKYFCFGLRQISSLSRTVPSRERGVSRSSRTRGGMRWTRQRARRTRPEADGEVVWGMPGETGVTVVTTLVCLFYFAREAAAHRAPGIPCALCFLRANGFAKTRAHRAARSRTRIWNQLF